MTPSVSVLLATRNNATTLGCAIGSILGQSFGDFEIIVVNDGSTDDTAGVLRAIYDERLVVLTNRSSQGLASSLNLAASHARGGVFARMDADDESYPLRFERQIGRLRAEPALEVLGAGIDAILPGGKRVARVLPAEHQALVAGIHRINPFFHPTVVMRRRFFERNGGYAVEMQRAQDYDLWLRGFRQSKYANLQEPLLRYTAAPPRWRNAVYSSRALLRAAVRERSVRLFWGAVRPPLGWVSQRRRHDVS